MYAVGYVDTSVHIWQKSYFFLDFAVRGFTVDQSVLVVPFVSFDFENKITDPQEWHAKGVQSLKNNKL